MRRFLSLLFLLVLSLTASRVAAQAADPPKACPPPVHAARVTWQQRFAAANVSHDGHLTLEQAKGGYPAVARHFQDIDADHKGFVTEDDLRAWRATRKAARRQAKPPEDRLRARSAVQHVDPNLRPIWVSAPAAPAPSTDSPGVDR